MRAPMTETHARSALAALLVAAAATLLLTACGDGPPKLELVPDKSDVLAVASRSDDQGEAVFRDDALDIDLAVQVQDRDTKQRISGIDVLVMASGEDVIFAAVDPAGSYFPVFTSKTRDDLARRPQDEYVTSGRLTFPLSAQATPVVLLLTKVGRIGWQEVRTGLKVAELVQRFGIFEAEHCLTPAELERTGGFPGKFVLVALPPSGLLEGTPVTGLAVLADQAAEFLTLRGMPDQPFLARAYRLPRVPLWVLEVGGPCVPRGGRPASPPISPFVSPPGVSPPGSPPCPPGASPPCAPSPWRPSPPGPTPPSPPGPTPPSPPQPTPPSPPGPTPPSPPQPTVPPRPTPPSPPRPTVPPRPTAPSPP